MIICCGATKGGVGKSTIATNLACLAACEYDVLLVDADDQQTAADFTAARKQDHPSLPQYTCTRLSGKNVRTEILAMKDKYDHVIIDTGGRDTTSMRAALTVSDVLLVPFTPRSFDIWTLGTMNTIVEEVRTVNPSLQAWAFINRADPMGQGSENSEAAAILAESPALAYLDNRIGNFKAFAHASSQGLSIVEYGKNATAAAQIQMLYQECMKDCYAQAQAS